MDDTKKKYELYDKHVKHVILLLAGILIFSADLYSVTAQSDSTEKFIRDLREKAIRFDKKNEVFNAIEYYSRYLACQNKDIDLTYRLASLYFLTRNYTKASQYYDAVIALNPKKIALAYYFKGLACMNTGNYKDAIELFQKFKKNYRAKHDKNNYKKLATIYAASSEWALNNSVPDNKFIITHQGNALNHSDIDFAPFPVNDGTILYGAVYSDPGKGIEPIRQIFKAKKINGKWESAGLFEGEINDPAFNTGNAAVSEDGRRLYFTRSHKNWLDKYVSEIFVSSFDGRKWLIPEKLPYPVNSENYSSTQPALGKNLKNGNDILYFLSDRPGGRGGYDIWFTEFNIKTGKYTDVVNLPGTINTFADECSPFYDISTRTLYFSSKGRKNGLGGFDIYKTTGSERKWAEVLPLPAPVNSSYDDYYFTIFRDNREGFFSSNRPGSLSLDNGTCCDDIFAFNITECVLINSVGIVRNSGSNNFYKSIDEKYHLGLVTPEPNSPLSEVPVELYLTDENGKIEMLFLKTTTDKNGSYHFDLDRDKHYSILIRNYGFSEKKIQLNTMGKNCNDTIHFGTALIEYLPKIRINLNIYYEFDSYKLSDSARKVIDDMVMPLFDLFPKGIFEIGSHTDNVGTDLYNVKLSQKRSESVVDYIISRGIPVSRIVARGFGSQVPVAPNTNSDGSDNPAGRQMNRRTEIYVVGEINSTSNDE